MDIEILKELKTEFEIKHDSCLTLAKQQNLLSEESRLKGKAEGLKIAIDAVDFQIAQFKAQMC